MVGPTARRVRRHSVARTVMAGGGREYDGDSEAQRDFEPARLGARVRLAEGARAQTLGHRARQRCFEDFDRTDAVSLLREARYPISLERRTARGPSTRKVLVERFAVAKLVWTHCPALLHAKDARRSVHAKDLKIGDRRPAAARDGLHSRRMPSRKRFPPPNLGRSARA